MLINNDLFLAALQAIMNVPAVLDEGQDSMARARRAGYEAGQDLLRTMAQAEPYTEGNELEYDRTRVTPITQLAFTLREALDGVMLAIKRGDESHAILAANAVNLAALELNEHFRLLGLPGMRLNFHWSDDREFGDPQLPAELMAQLTEAEKLIVPPGYRLEDCPTEEQQPYCDLTPCEGCDLRRKILSFRALLEGSAG